MASNSITVVEEVDILVVGAGPAGLATALSLQHHAQLVQDLGIRRPKILVCDAHLGRKEESRAYVVQTRTLEVNSNFPIPSPAPLIRYPGAQRDRLREASSSSRSRSAPNPTPVDEKS